MRRTCCGVSARSGIGRGRADRGDPGGADLFQSEGAAPARAGARGGAAAGGDDPYDRLTEREREILQLVAEGNSSKEIAVRLFLSVLAVETHRKKVMEKLGLRGTPEAVLYAARRGIVARIDPPKPDP